MGWKYDYLVEQLGRANRKNHENYVVGSLIHDAELKELKPCTQYYVKRKDAKYALIDLYYPQIELAVEIDEPHHAGNKRADEQRQRIVADELNCEFIRIEIELGQVPKQIAALKRKIRNKMSKYKLKPEWTDWKKPKTLNIFEAKKQFRNTLFVKIRGRIHPKDLMSRQTGYWLLAEAKRENIQQVVVVHDGVISRVFDNIKWQKYKKEPKKVGFTGNESDVHAVVGSIVENWKWQKAFTYSEDLY